MLLLCLLGLGAEVVHAQVNRVSSRRSDAGYGQQVSAVELRSDVRGLDVGELWRQVVLEPGQPLTEGRVRRTLSNLQAQGIASDIEVLTRPAEDGDGVVAVVVLRGDFRISDVEIEGQLGVRASRLQPRIEVRTGAPLIESQLLRSVYALQDFYAEQGFRDAIVRLAVDVDEEQKTARVTFRVEAGERATIASVVFEGDLGPFSPEELREPLRLREGDQDAPSQLSADRDRLRRWLRERSYLRARVEPAEQVLDADENTVLLRWQVEVGPEVLIELVGDDLSRLRKRGLTPFAVTRGFDEALVQEGIRRMRRYYQEQGFYDVDIDTRVEISPDPGSGRPPELIDFTVTVEHGRPHRVVELRFEGNQSFDASALRPLFITAAPGRLVDEELRADLDNLRNYYLLQGFPDVRVGPVALDREVTSRRAGAAEADAEVETVLLTVTVPIEEGQRRVVSGIGFEGMEVLEPARLDLPLETGGAFHRQLVDESVRRIRSAYEERGFDEARVSSEVSWDDSGLLAYVLIEVDEGLRTIVDRVLVRGNLVSRTEMVRRVAGLEQGEPLSRSRLLEAQRRLYQLGVFSRVEIEPVPRRREPSPFEIRLAEETGEPLSVGRDLVIRVSEGKRWRLSYGGSWDSESGFGGLFGSSYNNVWGRASTLRLDLRANERQQRYRLLFNDRTLFGGELFMNYIVYRIDEIVSEFDSERYGVQVEGSHYFSDRVRGSLFLDYRNVDLAPRDIDVPTSRLDDGDGGIPPDLDRAFAPVEIASLTGTAFWDRRDDLISPSDGFSVLAQAEQAFRLFSAEEQFTRVFLQGTHYWPLIEPFGTIAASVRFGAIDPQGGSLEDVDAVPIAERFFAGGRTSHRAYERDELGIPGETVIEGIAVGGNGLVLVNLDWRFPIFGSFGGTVFFDTGNVWRQYSDIDFSEFKHGAGVGVRYDSPVGPIRFDVGFKLDPEVGEDREVYFLSFGYPF